MREACSLTRLRQPTICHYEGTVIPQRGCRSRARARRVVGARDRAAEEPEAVAAAAAAVVIPQYMYVLEYEHIASSVLRAYILYAPAGSILMPSASHACSNLHAAGP